MKIHAIILYVNFKRFLQKNTPQENMFFYESFLKSIGSTKNASNPKYLALFLIPKFKVESLTTH